MVKEWFQKYGRYLDILAILCDSFNEDTKYTIGRRQGNKSHLSTLQLVQSMKVCMFCKCG
uniref:Uncharacterized protein n=1 Tax=Amphimedon queenslandica TaxID=400682 RepID=A0A1X7UH73_AMPQE